MLTLKTPSKGSFQPKEGFKNGLAKDIIYTAFPGPSVAAFTLPHFFYATSIWGSLLAVSLGRLMQAEVKAN